VKHLSVKCEFLPTLENGLKVKTTGFSLEINPSGFTVNDITRLSTLVFLHTGKTNAFSKQRHRCITTAAVAKTPPPQQNN